VAPKVRALFLVLLLANILFLAWTRWIAPTPDAGGHATPSSGDSRAIRLLREEPLQRQESSVAQGTGPVGLGAAATCVSGGPYLDRAGAEQAAARLDGLGFNSRLRASRDEVWVGQWVRIEDLATAEDAGNALATLKAAGIADAYLLADEPPGSVVSLGVFSDAGRAAQVIAAATKAGFTPKVEDRYRPENVFWLDVDRDTNAGLPGQEMFRIQDGGGTRIELRACPEPDSVTPAAPAP
jgi:hypothetical protein